MFASCPDFIQSTDFTEIAGGVQSAKNSQTIRSLDLHAFNASKALGSFRAIISISFLFFLALPLHAGITAKSYVVGKGSTFANGDILVADATDPNAVKAVTAHAAIGQIYGTASGMLTLPAGGYTLPAATNLALGGLKLAQAADASAATLVNNTTMIGRNYRVKLDSTNTAYVNVPWIDTDTNTTYSAGTGISINLNNEISATGNGISNCAQYVSAVSPAITYKSCTISGTDGAVNISIVVDVWGGGITNGSIAGQMVAALDATFFSAIAARTNQVEANKGVPIICNGWVSPPYTNFNPSNPAGFISLGHVGAYIVNGNIYVAQGQVSPGRGEVSIYCGFHNY